VIRRFNPKYGKNACVIVAGEYFATRDDMLIETVLGSCIAVCLMDAGNGVSGMNHFMLPSNRADPADASSRAGRYGAHAMELLINEMMHQGADRLALTAKVFGGGNVTRVREGTLRVGEWNTAFALDFLEREGIPVAARDVGGLTGRRIVLFTREGNVKLRRLGGSETGRVVTRELDYHAHVVERPEPRPAEDALTLF
jgi:chemotaxis protein CheD